MATSALNFLDEPRFNRSVELPGINGQDAFKVTYADFGHHADEPKPDGEHVLLYMGPMMASRFIYTAKDGLAKKYGVRVICLDRPGFGGTQAVPLGKRIDVTREMTIALLKHLNIQHVSIASHSGGAVYAFDLLLHHPVILNPDRPYLALGAPWVHPTHSGVVTMRITSMLPHAAIGSVDKIASFFMQAQPVLGPAMGFISGMGNYVSGVSSNTKPADPDDDEAVQFEAEVQKKFMSHMHGHGIHGLPDEALTLMWRVDDGTTKGWGSWGDYDVLLPQLSDRLRAAGKKLTVRAFWAEKDNMIGAAGSKGPRWLEECIEKETKGEDAVISYSSSVIQGGEHDTAKENRFGVPQIIFRDVIGEQSVRDGV